MPIKISDSLPARAILESENIFAITEYRATHQDIRPLKLVILNLMPTKIATETQLLRCLSNTPLQIEITLLQTSTYTSKNTSPEHLLSFYSTFESIRNSKFDGMIITGAPVETLEFEQVEYWRELCEIMEWSKTNVYTSFHICWGAQAALYYHYGIPKYPLDSKLFGIFKHKMIQHHLPLFRGFDDVFFVPHSRHTTIRREDIEASRSLLLLADSDEAGVYAVMNSNGRQIFITGHPEYDADTLALEYFRDRAKGLHTATPVNYFKDNDPNKPPTMIWRSHAQLMYSNWLNYYMYQNTPYDLKAL